MQEHTTKTQVTKNGISKEQIIQAMKDGYVISFVYNELPRLIEGHAIGIHKNTGNVVLRAYQIGGESNSSEIPCWRMFTLNEVTNLRITSAKSQAPRKNYRKGDKHMRAIYFEL